jgi:hypothetical protein
MHTFLLQYVVDQLWNRTSLSLSIVVVILKTWWRSQYLTLPNQTLIHSGKYKRKLDQSFHRAKSAPLEFIKLLVTLEFVGKPYACQNVQSIGLPLMIGSYWGGGGGGVKEDKVFIHAFCRSFMVTHTSSMVI